MTTQPGPAPKPSKSRLLQDGRDMFWSIAPLVIACIVLAGVLGMCSFQPSGPGKSPAPAYDAQAALQADANDLDIPIRGRWRLDVAVTVGEFDQRRATFTVPID